MIKSVALAFLLNVLIACGTALAQIPGATTVKLDSVTVEFTNIEVVTSPKMYQDKTGTHPVNPLPLSTSKLYPPETHVFVKFDYKTDLKPTEDPQGVKSIAVAVDIPKVGEHSKGGFRGYGPCSLKERSGTGYIWLSNVFSDEKTKIAEIATNMLVYGHRNDNTQFPSVSAPDQLRFNLSIDRLAQISETQFDAIKAMYKQIQDLEKRVKALESQRSN